MIISIIAAIDDNGLIGNHGQLPWHIPEDLAWFKQLTMGNTVIMGRNTFLSLGKPLPGRQNIVLTHNPVFAYDGIEVLHNVSEVIASAQGLSVFVIGGAQIFQQFLPLASQMYITRIHATYAGDTYFPKYPEQDWKLIYSSKCISVTGVSLSFEQYRRLELPDNQGRT